MRLTLSDELPKDVVLKSALALVSGGKWRDGSNVLEIGNNQGSISTLVTDGVMTNEFIELFVRDVVNKMYRPLEEQQRTDHLIAEAKNAAREFSGGPVFFNPHSELLEQLADEIEWLRNRLAEAVAVPAEYLVDGGSRANTKEVQQLADKIWKAKYGSERPR